MANLDILCFNPFNSKNKIMKIEHTKIFRDPSKILKNVSWPITICLKYFMAPHKKPSGPPSYILNVWSLIEDSIRQGRPLPSPEFGLLIDELNVELRTTDLGVQYGFIIIICLLFMDDIALLARSAKELQEIVNMTNLFLNKWNLNLILKKYSYDI